MSTNLELDVLLYTCGVIARRNLTPATSGNFSIRVGTLSMKISRSGVDKSQLSEIDFLVCDVQGNLISGEGKPSAEAALHGMIYQLSSNTGCVLHTHSVAVTVLSMLPDTDNQICFKGYEMQKAIQGFCSHEESLTLTVFDNDQDMHRLAKHVQEIWPKVLSSSAFIVRGHGLYCWGNTVKDAKRHMEGIEFLVECALQTKRYSHA